MSKYCPKCSYINENQNKYCFSCNFKFDDQFTYRSESSKKNFPLDSVQNEEIEEKTYKLISNLEYRIVKLENRLENMHKYDNSSKFIDVLYIFSLIGLIGLFLLLIISLFSNTFFISPLIIFFGLITNVIYFMSLREIRNIVKRH